MSVLLGDILALDRVTRIYLDELEEKVGQASCLTLGVKVVKLIIEREGTIVNQAKTLVQRVKEELPDERVRKSLIELITKIIIYKLPQKTYEEVKAMFELGELEKTQFYQDVLARGEQRGEQKTKFQAIPKLLEEGLSIEQIARVLDLPLKTIQQEAEKYQQE